MKFIKKLNNFIFLFISFNLTSVNSQLLHYYCIPSDAKHFHMLKNLIASIHLNDFRNLGEIAVFNLGLNKQHIQQLKKMRKVKVYDVEITNPKLLRYFTTSPNGRQVRGYFAWKPVIIKQALEKFPYVLYLDSGTTILKPLNDLFEYINQNGYFLLSCTNDPNCNIINRVTKKTLNNIVLKLNQDQQIKILNDKTIQIDAGLQGISKKIYNDYVFPMYKHSYNLKLFEDDGSAKFGYGAGRHDQMLFSIYAHKLNLKIHNEGYINLEIGDKIKQIHIHWSKNNINPQTCIYRSRDNINFKGINDQNIRYKTNV